MAAVYWISLHLQGRWSQKFEPPRLFDEDEKAKILILASVLDLCLILSLMVSTLKLG